MISHDSDRLFEQTFASEASLREFQQSVIAWFEQEGKSYPWRETTDPYAILVSELMLQQTQIATVLGRGYYTRWHETFPDLETLASADEEELLSAWEGLGYYNRVRNLQKTARVLLEEHDGRFPETVEGLLALPGVGRYTAGAVASFAFDKSAPIVDGNVIRVMARLLGQTDPVDTTEGKKWLWKIAEFWTPPRKAKAFNSGIMELGQQTCHRSSPSCCQCPVSKWCRAFADGMTPLIPAKSQRTKVEEREERVGFLLENGQVRLVPESGSRRRGLWKLPSINDQDEIAEELLRFTYAITRFRVRLTVYRCRQSPSQPSGSWFSLNDPDSWPPLGSPYKKALLKLQTFEHDELFSLV
ncbi:MAG: A/G-specific adenine glycosylase [Verrucomicrobiota bacterium]